LNSGGKKTFPSPREGKKGASSQVRRPVVRVAVPPSPMRQKKNKKITKKKKKKKKILSLGKHHVAIVEMRKGKTSSFARALGRKNMRRGKGNRRKYRNERH